MASTGIIPPPTTATGAIAATPATDSLVQAIERISVSGNPNQTAIDLALAGARYTENYVNKLKKWLISYAIITLVMLLVIVITTAAAAAGARQAAKGTDFAPANPIPVINQAAGP